MFARVKTTMYYDSFSYRLFAVMLVLLAISAFIGSYREKTTTKNSDVPKIDDQRIVRADYNTYHVVEARTTPDGQHTIVKRCENLDRTGDCDEIVIDAPMTLGLKYDGTTARLSSGNMQDGSRIITYRKIPDCLPSPLNDCTEP